MDTIHGFTRACIVTPFLSKVCVAKTLDQTLSILNMTTIVIITKVLNVHDPMIGMMGALSWVTSFMVWALATQGWMMYLATGLSSIGMSVLDILGKRSGILTVSIQTRVIPESQN